MQSAVLIFNPAAGKHRAESLARELIPVLGGGGYDCQARPTTGPGDASRLAREAAAEGASAVFALGGDGTLREAAAGLLGTETALGFLPTGTANVMALALGLPSAARAAARRAAELRPTRFDVGWCGDEPFLMMASAGLDGAALQAIDPRLKRRLGRAGIALSGLRAWWRYDYPAITVEAAGAEHEATLVVASNIPYYGGSLNVAPGASYEDGLLDVVLFRGSGRRATLAFARDLALRRHLGRSDTDHLQTDRLRLTAPRRFAAQLDGDPRDATAPLDIRVQPSALRLLRLP